MILYHYCSNFAFHSIIKEKAIWLSSLSLSNDAMEGKWLRKILLQICVEQKIDKYATQRIMAQLEHLESVYDSLGFCLSELGDMLSQWRGYADDASGMCIGFSVKYLENLVQINVVGEKSGISLQKIVYDSNNQKQIIMPVLESMQDHIKKGAFQFSKSTIVTWGDSPENKQKDKEKNKEYSKQTAEVIGKIFRFFPELYRLKNPAFREEQEWRLTSPFIKIGKGHIEYCEYRTSSNRLIPYRIIELSETDNPSISEVILGPKNITPIPVVEEFLNQYGFRDVRVVESSASYR